MKRASLGLLLGFIAGASGVAPREAAAQSLDLRAGWVRSGFGGDRVVEHDGLNGGSLSVGFALTVTPRLSIQPELQLVQKGATRRSSWTGVAGGDTIFGRFSNPLRLFYAQVPVLATFELSARSSGVRPYLAAGPYVGWLLHCSSYLEPVADGGVVAAPPGDSVAVGAACIHNGTRQPDAGAAAGAGVRLPLGSATGVVDLRFEQGFSSVVKGLWGDAHNRMISLTAGVSLPLGGSSGAHRR